MDDIDIIDVEPKPARCSCTSQSLQPCPYCERDPDNTFECDHCHKRIDAEPLVTTADENLCQDCWDDAPSFSNCCGYEAKGIDLDYQICGDCHDHCEYEK